MTVLGFQLEEFHPNSPDFLANPYPYFDAMRLRGPVVHLPRLPAYWAVGHAEVSRLFTDPVFGVRPSATGEQPLPAPYEKLNLTSSAMLYLDPPTHTRVRGLVSKAFTPRAVERLRPHIQDIVDRLLKHAAPAGGRLDLAPAVAAPLPATVIAELLGVPVEDQEQFRKWSNQIVASADAGSPPEAHAAGPAANLALVEYFEGLIRRRKEAPGADLISELVAAEEHGETLSYGELVATCWILLIAGHETTTGLITNGVLALMRNREQWERLCAQAALLNSAVEELLRYDPPVQRMTRFAREDVAIGGAQLKAGQGVLAVIAAANRDPQVFADPHKLDIARSPNPHVSFGKGIHYCLGAPLARLEAEIAFGELARRFPHMRLDPNAAPQWSGNTRFRSLRSLPVLV